MDRVDIKVEVSRPMDSELLQRSEGETSAAVRARVCVAREGQAARQGKLNALLLGKEIARYCAIDEAAEKLLKEAIAKLSLSARAYHRVLRVARSIADLAHSKSVLTLHLAEAIQYRRLDASF